QQPVFQEADEAAVKFAVLLESGGDVAALNRRADLLGDLPQRPKVEPGRRGGSGVRRWLSEDEGRVRALTGERHLYYRCGIKYYGDRIGDQSDGQGASHLAEIRSRSRRDSARRPGERSRAARRRRDHRSRG